LAAHLFLFERNQRKIEKKQLSDGRLIGCVGIARQPPPSAATIVIESGTRMAE
jgi:hypothetical protein